MHTCNRTLTLDSPSSAQLGHKISRHGQEARTKQRRNRAKDFQSSEVLSTLMFQNRAHYRKASQTTRQDLAKTTSNTKCEREHTRQRRPFEMFRIGHLVSPVSRIWQHRAWATRQRPPTRIHKRGRKRSGLHGTGDSGRVTRGRELRFQTRMRTWWGHWNNRYDLRYGEEWYGRVRKSHCVFCFSLESQLVGQGRKLTWLLRSDKVQDPKRSQPLSGPCSKGNQMDPRVPTYFRSKQHIQSGILHMYLAVQTNIHKKEGTQTV